MCAKKRQKAPFLSTGYGMPGSPSAPHRWMMPFDQGARTIGTLDRQFVAHWLDTPGSGSGQVHGPWQSVDRAFLDASILPQPQRQANFASPTSRRARLGNGRS
jgi:hypothetical protein